MSKQTNTLMCSHERIGTAVLNKAFVSGKPYYLAADVLNALGMRAKGGHKLGRYLDGCIEARKESVQRVGMSRPGTTWLVSPKGLTNLLEQLNPRTHQGKMAAQRMIRKLTEGVAETVEPTSEAPVQAELFNDELVPSITAFQFDYDDQVLRLVSAGSTRYVPLRDLCRNLGLDYSAQYKRITADKRFDWEYIPAIDSQQKKRDTVCLSLMSIHGWLYTISVNRVAPELREALLHYQKHLTTAIYDYCTKGYASMHAIEETRKDQRIETQATQISALTTQLGIVTEHAKSLEGTMKYIQANTPKPIPNVPVPQKTVRSQVVQHVRGFATKMLHQYGCIDDPAAKDKYFDDLWIYLYTDFKYRVGADYLTRYKNAEEKTSVLAMIEKDGKIEEFYAMVRLLLPVNKYANQFAG